jgi:hypothetical protein
MAAFNFASEASPPCTLPATQPCGMRCEQTSELSDIALVLRMPPRPGSKSQRAAVRCRLGSEHLPSAVGWPLTYARFGVIADTLRKDCLELSCLSFSEPNLIKAQVDSP